MILSLKEKAVMEGTLGLHVYAYGLVVPTKILHCKILEFEVKIIITLKNCITMKCKL